MSSASKIDFLAQHLFVSPAESIADARKLFCFGRFVNEYVRLQSVLHSGQKKDDSLGYGLELGARTSYLCYWIQDALLLLIKLKVLPGRGV